MSGGGNSAPPVITWRPSKKDAKYIGPQACAKCHAALAATQPATSMGSAAQTVETSEVLRSYSRLTFRSDPYAYEITRRGLQSLYTVTDGTNTFSEPILYAFGQGKAGQTYIFRHNGALYETRVSFYQSLRGLDWTMGYQLSRPASLDDAAGRPLGAGEARECFACHTTAAVNGSQLQLERMIPGVTCEACHGPGAEHAAAMATKNNAAPKRIFNPARMEPDELAQEFCGSCHRSAEQVLSNKIFNGLVSVRFQPYRIFTSHEHDPDDARLSCTACHNPHTHLAQDAAYYDQKCFACHLSARALAAAPAAKATADEGRTAKPCPVSQRLCVSCHMPKVEVPGTHFQFTDHRIRIAHDGEPFPN